MSADRAGLLAIYRRLDRMHAWRGWHWWPDAEPFEVIVGAILVQNTAWANVERALDALRAASVLDPGTMDGLEQSQLEALVRPSGQYRQKARKLRALLETAREAGSVRTLLELPPAELRARLLATWGIGEETADCIVLYAAHRPSFVIDAYTQRLFTRLGLGPGSPGYGSWKAYFEGALDEPDDGARRELWARYHALVVLHCKHLCLKRAPRCGDCELAPTCTLPGPA